MVAKPITTSVTFETAALADVVKKAAKVAPSKGKAFDKAAGIMFEFDPQGPAPFVVVRATDLEIFSMEWLTIDSWEGAAAQWLMPSSLLAQVVASLPIGTGKTTMLYVEEGSPHIVHLKCGRTRVKFFLIEAQFYPPWGAFDPDHMFPATDLGGRIAQVEWAASQREPQLAGVYIDGEYAIATDSYRMARVPLSIPDLAEPIIVPGNLLAQVLRQTGDVQIGVVGKMLHIMPDEYTQVKTVTMDVKYPKVMRVMEAPLDTSIKVDRDQFLEVMRRCNSFAEGDRTASFKMFFGKEELAVFMVNSEKGQIGETIEIPGYALHERFQLNFTPKNIIEPVDKCPNRDLEISYNYGVKTIVKIDGGSGYLAWAMPRLGSSEAEQ